MICKNFPGDHTCSCQAGLEMADGRCQGTLFVSLLIQSSDSLEMLIQKISLHEASVRREFAKEIGSSIYILKSLEQIGFQTVISLYPTDIDECHGDEHTCSEIVNTECVNVFGSYECRCQDGYHRNRNTGLCEGE